MRYLISSFYKTDSVGFVFLKYSEKQTMNVVLRVYSTHSIKQYKLEHQESIPVSNLKIQN